MVMRIRSWVSMITGACFPASILPRFCVSHFYKFRLKVACPSQETIFQAILHLSYNMSTDTAPNANGPKKSLVLNAFVEMCSGHHSPGLWKHPDDRSSEFHSVDHWIELAKLLESAKFHGIFIADVLGGYDVYQRSLAAAVKSAAQWPVHEPLAVISAMAAATKSLGFGVTVATTYEQPYHLARRLSTIDHLTKGRLGWNIVTGYLESAARNMGLSQLPEHDQR